MRRAALTLAAALMAASMSGSGAGASSTKHPPYPLGKAPACLPHYVKRIVKHKVKHRTVRVAMCFYVASEPKPKPKPKPTTTTAPRSPYPNGEPGDQGFAVASLQVSPDFANDIGGTIRITNVTNRTLSVSFTVTFFSTPNLNGTPVGSAESSALNVAPGETVTETLISTDPMFTAPRFWYQFQVDSEF